MFTHGIGTDAGLHPDIPSRLPLAALQEHLSDAEILALCRQLNHDWRDRKLPPPRMVRSMVYRSLHPDRSIAAVLAELAAEMDPAAIPPTDSAWCQARSHLPHSLWAELIARGAGRLSNAVGASYLYEGRPIFLFDGTTLSMPDEPDLAQTFGYSSSQHGHSRFPVARVSMLVRWGVWAICDYRMDPYVCNENEQFRQMWHRLPDGCICIVDTHFSSFFTLAKMAQRDIGVLAPLHQGRSPWALIRGGCRIGPNQWLVTLRLGPALRNKYGDPSLAQEILVRLIRVRRRGRGRHSALWLVTTLLNPVLYPAAVLAQWYRQRWPIETRIGSIKTTLQLNVLRSKTVVGARSEVAATILAHNLIWTVIHQAAQQEQVPPDRVSFAGAVKLILAFSHPLRLTHGPERENLYRRLLERIASVLNRDRPNRVEPRRIKRNPLRYPFLKEPRWKARLKCLS
jgi:hypothetical protein